MTGTQWPKSTNLSWNSDANKTISS